ncbi:hypothetical protein RIF29_10784 [Crotalaria pallida]|uniref:Uncharacterized protein n=1 Tax=Crotalaria pallida TaxID=3830 RepID=A0AAN9IK13_CROPI
MLMKLFISTMAPCTVSCNVIMCNSVACGGLLAFPSHAVDTHLCTEFFRRTLPCGVVLCPSHIMNMFCILTVNYVLDVVGMMTDLSSQREYLRDGNVTRMIVLELTDPAIPVSHAAPVIDLIVDHSPELPEDIAFSASVIVSPASVESVTSASVVAKCFT